MSAGFVLDLHRCVGCGACVLACRIEYGRATAAAWRRVLPLNLRRYDAGPTYFLSVACHHCDRPACLEGCPSGAYEKRPDGIVVHIENRCLGCRYCEMTCPFGTPQFDGDRGVMSKCHLCAPRVDAGREPACVAACPTGALQYAADVDTECAGSDRLRPDYAPRASSRSRRSAARGGGQGSGESAEAVAKAEDPVSTQPAERSPDGARGLPWPEQSRRQTPGQPTWTPTQPLVPGFDDPAGCGPNIRFRPPSGSVRAVRFDELEERLRR